MLLQTSPDFARIVNARHFGRVLDLMNTSGGEIIIGGQHDAASLFIAPTIIRNVNPSAKIMQVLCWWGLRACAP